MENNIYKIKESIDIYVLPKNETLVEIQFYKINTREKLTLEVSKYVCDLISKIDGKSTLQSISKSLNIHFSYDEAYEFFNFLEGRGIVTRHIHSPTDDETLNLIKRYARQINYFDDLLDNSDGLTVQKELIDKHVVIFGVGAIGSTIAIQLVRAGIKKLTLVDYKKISSSSFARHFFITDALSDGEYKVIELSKYLHRIDSKCSINCIIKKLKPESIMEDYIDNSVDLVVNTADEPYIGHTTLKIGRYLWPKEIALYVAGGFDAHLMSTGELIVKGLSPCPDCCSNTFKKALKDWKPIYPNTKLISTSNNSSDDSSMGIGIGGAGGLSSNSLFSASYAALNIINYLINNKKNISRYTKRGEYLINHGKMTWIELTNQNECGYCGSK